MTLDTNGKQTIGVEQIRELSAHTYMTPNELDLKVYIIDHADKMTAQAQNAFLKTLEEPVTNVMYFLICENSQMLLPTIISRAPIIRTVSLSREVVHEYLDKNFPHVDENKRKLVSVITRGNLGDANDLLSDEELFKEREDQRNTIYSFLDVLKLKSGKYEVFDFFTSEIEKNSTTIERLRLLYSALRDIIAYKEMKIKEFDFFIDVEDVSKYTVQIKPKYAKKLCSHIEDALAQLYLNQGSSSVYSIMFALATEAWSAKN
jgi:DNA polymerase-3 subunit delta'